MAVIFSRNSGQNDDLWKTVETPLMAVMQDVDNEKNDDDKLVKALFTEKKSKKALERATGLTSFSSFDIVDEGDSAPLDDLQQGFAKTVMHSTFKKGFVCTREMREDGNIDTMKTAAANFIRAYKRSRAQLASGALSGQGASFIFGSREVDKTTGDGKALFAVDHPGKKTGVGAQSNVFTNPFGNGTLMLNRLANVGRNFKNDSGQAQGYTFDTIVIPSNVPDMEDLIKRVIRSDLIVGSSNNDVNTQKGLWSLVVDHHWQVPEGKRPYILMSSQANKELMGSLFFDRTPLDVKNEVEIDTHNLKWVGYTRFSAGFYNWRHVIMGGADAGSTLPDA